MHDANENAFNAHHSIKYLFLDIGSCNQLSMKHKWCILKQTHSFAGNIPKRRTFADRDKLTTVVGKSVNQYNTAL